MGTFGANRDAPSRCTATDCLVYVEPLVAPPDLNTMMMACSDLTVPQKAKGFVKPSMKDIRPSTQTTTPAFQESQSARKWNSDTDTLSNLFTLPCRCIYYVLQMTLFWCPCSGHCQHSLKWQKTFVATTVNTFISPSQHRSRCNVATIELQIEWPY